MSGGHARDGAVPMCAPARAGGAGAVTSTACVSTNGTGRADYTRVPWQIGYNPGPSCRVAAAQEEQC